MPVADPRAQMETAVAQLFSKRLAWLWHVSLCVCLGMGVRVSWNGCACALEWVILRLPKPLHSCSATVGLLCGFKAPQGPLPNNQQETEPRSLVGSRKIDHACHLHCCAPPICIAGLFPSLLQCFSHLCRSTSGKCCGWGHRKV